MRGMKIVIAFFVLTCFLTLNTKRSSLDVTNVSMMYIIWLTNRDKGFEAFKHTHIYIQTNDITLQENNLVRKKNPHMISRC